MSVTAHTSDPDTCVCVMTDRRVADVLGYGLLVVGVALTLLARRISRGRHVEV